MSLSHVIPMFNLSPANSNATFHLFSALPKELRLMIWKLALQQNRIIRIHLSDPDLEDPSTCFKTINFEPIRSGEDIGRYSIIIDGFQALNKLLHVCKESRRECLTHYRVHLPCRFVKSRKHSIYNGLLSNAVAADKLDSFAPKGNFYLNPEWDYVEVKCWPRTSALLFPFLTDLRCRYDPAGIGLLNLVVPPTNFFTPDLCGLRSTNLPQGMREITAAALKSLQNVFFKQTAISGRVSFGEFMCDGPWETWFNRALPINTRIPRFELVCPDPRPVSKDLKRQWMGGTGSHWHEAYRSFAALFAEFDIVPSQTPAQYRWMLSYHPTGLNGGIYSRDDAETWLQKDHDKWWVDRSRWPSCADKRVFENEEYVMDVEPAFGFWLFPLDAMNAESSDWHPGDGHVFDMRNYMPDLAVTVMP